MTDVRTAVRHFFVDTLTIDVSDDSEDLIQSGRLDSLALVEVLFFLEQRFGVRTVIEELDLDDYRSIDAICRTVNSKAARESGPG